MALPTLFGRRRDLSQSSADPFTSLRHEMERLFDEFRGVGGGPYGALEPAFVPSIEMRQTDKGIEITAELPGMSEQDIDISLDDNVLTLRGEKKIEQEKDERGRHVTERVYGTFVRAIPLPIEVDESKVSAQFKNGVLKIELPAAADNQRKSKRIPVKSS